MALTTRTWLGSTGYELRHRYGYDGNGMGLHTSPPDSHAVENGFLARMDAWASNQSVYGSSYGSVGLLDWIGDVGFYAERDDPSAHEVYRAMDLTACGHTGGVIDTNWSWKQDLEKVRKYLGTYALARREVGNVLTCWYNSDHHDHIHLDDWRLAEPLKEWSKVDAAIIRAASRFLNNSNVAVDSSWNWTGSWSTETNNAYTSLLVQFNMKCLDPKTNASHARLFLGYIAAHAFKNENAGYYQYSC